MFINDDEVSDYSLLIEKMLVQNDAYFPAIMDFLKINKFVPDLHKNYHSIGYTIINNINDAKSRCTLKRNLKYLYDNDCDINMELLHFLRSLTFGGKLIKHGDQSTNILVIKTLLPFCTNFFHDETKYWNKIRHFCFDTEEIIDALKFLILNYGREENFKYLHPTHNKKIDAFSLKHLARNKVRETIWQGNDSNNKGKSGNNKKCNTSYYDLCKSDLPAVLFKYICFLD
jgi:hypothetical protein